VTHLFKPCDHAVLYGQNVGKTRALLKLRLGNQVFAFDFRGQLQLQPATDEGGDTDHQHRQKQGQSGTAHPDRIIQSRLINPETEVIEPVGELAPHLQQAAGKDIAGWFFFLQVTEVTGQDKQRLNNRKGQCGYRHCRDGSKQLGPVAGHKQHGHKHNKGGQNRQHHRFGDTGYPGDGRHGAAHLAFVHGVNVFADDNGIIHHDTENQQKGEGGHHIDAHPHHGHGGQGAEIGHGNPRRYPDRQQRPQEQQQQDKHQGQTLE